MDRSPRDDFHDARATSFYRYLLPGFRDLYGVDFDTITDEQARELNDKIFANYKDDKWLLDVITRRANIELMFIDPYWARLQFERAYKFAVPVLNVSMMIGGTHPSRFTSALDSPYVFAERQGRRSPRSTTTWPRSTRSFARRSPPTRPA